MKFLNKKVLISVLLTLVFSVAVSGGCGGGGGGHYSGDFGGSGDSSENTTPEDFTTEYVSSDVAPIEPDEPALSEQFTSENADNDYGARGEITSFTLLNKTTWSIDQVAIYEHNNGSKFPNFPNTESKLYNGSITDIQTITFATFDDNTLLWATQKNKKEFYSSDVIMKFKDPKYRSLLSAPILRSGNFSVSSQDSFKYDFYQASINRNELAGTETIEVLKRLNTNKRIATKIRVHNEFKASNRKAYRCVLSLSRVDNFFLLDHTDWQIKNVRVVGLIKDSDGKSSAYGDPKNYPVYFNPKENTDKITLFTGRNKDGARYFDFTENDGEPMNQKNLKFRDTILSKDFEAPILRSAEDFKSEGKENNGYDVYKTTVTSEILPEEFQKANPNQVLLYVSDYGPNGYVTLYNSFFVNDQDSEGNDIYHLYWAILDLEPYKSK